MKRAALFLLLLFAGACCFVWLSAVLADGPADPPEFFFTRLAYNENPTGCCRHNYRGFGRFRIPTMPIPPQYECPEFGGKNFFPPQGWGWGTDYPGGDCKFMGGIHRLTGMRVSSNPNIIAPMDPDLSSIHSSTRSNPAACISRSRKRRRFASTCCEEVFFTWTIFGEGANGKISKNKCIRFSPTRKWNYFRRRMRSFTRSSI